MYVCGPTVYDRPHVGHGRFSLVFDVLRRYLTWSGYDVTYVSNVTDIEDKIIARAIAEGRPFTEITEEYEAVWYRAMDDLGVQRPDHDPHATAYVERMVQLIDDLFNRGAAYVIDGDGVYFRSETVDDYGLLARQSLDKLRTGSRVEVVAGKESPLDFVLWKLAKEGEPSWPSPWGAGRPGWNTECVVMSLDLLGDGFDIHGGGFDLAFPHHENERAQAVAAGRTFATHWVHNGFVELGGEKMSKSVGNVMSLTDLIEQHDPRAYRLLVLRSHYRSPMEVTAATLTDAEAALERLDKFDRRTATLPRAEPNPDVIERFRVAMDDDLDTPRATAVIFEAVKAANVALDDKASGDAARIASSVRELVAALGLELRGRAPNGIPEEVRERVALREEARKAKEFAEADRLRDELAVEGWVIEDGADGVAVRRAD